MAPCLSKFPSVCLEAIFKHVPLVDLLHSVGLVCSSWYTSRLTELLRRRRLRLIDRRDYEIIDYQRVDECYYGTELIERIRRDDGTPWHTLESAEQFKFNCLPIPEGMHTIHFVSTLKHLPNITRLHLKLTRTSSDVPQIIRLRDHLSDQLVELKLKIYFNLDRANDEEDYDRAIRERALNETNLIDSLNGLQSLRHLNLVLSQLHSHPPLLSCLSHLTTFAISSDFFVSMAGWIYASLRQYAQNVTSIQNDNLVDNREMLQFDDAQLGSKFTVLSVIYNQYTDFDLENDRDFDKLPRMPMMSLFGARFSCLTKLTLCLMSFYGPLMMIKLSECLSLLAQLVHFDVTFHDLKGEREEQLEGVLEEEEDEEEEEIELFEKMVDQALHQLPSVRLLTIRLLHSKSHHDSDLLYVPEIFPNLQVIRLDQTITECSVCGINRMDAFVPELSDRIAECKRLARHAFRYCDNLHIFASVVSSEEILIDPNEL